MGTVEKPVDKFLGKIVDLPDVEKTPSSSAFFQILIHTEFVVKTKVYDENRVITEPTTTTVFYITKY